MWNISNAFCTLLRAFVFAFYPLMMLAQTANTGAIAGSVSDPSGAPAAGAASGSWCGIRQLEAIVMNNRRRKGDQFQECSIQPSLGRSLARPKKRYAQL
jgi:hypothetical protein